MTIDPSTGNLPQLSAAPIGELICGIHFESIRGMTPVLHGLFFGHIRDEYPIHESHSFPDFGPPTILPFNTRTVFSETNRELALHLERNLFHLNWVRRPDSEYPRFGGDNGLLRRTLSVFEKFCDFCAGECESQPEVKSLQVTKVNSLWKKGSWRDFADALEMIPMLQGTTSLIDSQSPDLNIRLARPLLEEGSVIVGLKMGTARPPTGEPDQLIQLEIGVHSRVESIDLLESRFEEANRLVNQTFLEVIPDALIRFA